MCATTTAKQSHTICTLLESKLQTFFKTPD